ncbi:MAG: hypothetical protein J2P16_07455 [Mycobacterium sp.]|nr:hypothetical protein [Mycobacterium sp.]
MRSLIGRSALATTVLTLAAVTGCTTGTTTDRGSSGSGSPHQVQPPRQGGARPQDPAATAPDPGNGPGGNQGDGGQGNGGGNGRGGNPNIEKDPKPQTNAVPGIALAPDSVTQVCHGAQDCGWESITIRSTGNSSLNVYDISIQHDSSPSGARFITDGTQCVDTTLDPGESCTFSVRWWGPPRNTVNDVYTADLLIFDNLPDQPTYVGLTRVPLP